MATAARRAFIGRLLTRGVWGALSLIHAPILAAVVSSLIANPGGVERLASAVALLVVTLLFLLKALDVAWLRIGTTRQGIWVLCLAAAFVHHEALGSSRIVAPAAVAVAASGTELGRHARRLIRILRTLLRGVWLTPHALIGVAPTLHSVRLGAYGGGLIRARGPPQIA